MTPRNAELVRLKVVDIDDQLTWPTAIRDAVDHWAERCAGATKYTCDLNIEHSDQRRFHDLFDGYFVRAFHYTRLLAHERMWIRAIGLQPLSESLLLQRIEEARRKGFISSRSSKVLSHAHVFAAGELNGRDGQVCFVLSRNVFRRSPEDCLPLLGHWGGEAIYRSSGAVSFISKLKKLGTPTVVTALLDVSGKDHDVVPSLLKAFVGSRLRLKDVGADVFYRAMVPPRQIVSMRTIAESRMKILVREAGDCG